jgi:thiamine-phosphate pyrophosphorylase
MYSRNLVLCRILDANLDRAREGLRVIEEWCRFGLNSASFTEKCKQLRQELAAWHSSDLRVARNTPGDLGTHLTHSQEKQRVDIQAVLQVNFSRVEEALRVLEEYGKLYNSSMGEAFKQMRYQAYSLESALLMQERYQKLLRSPLYLVTSPSERLFAIVEAALQSGLTLIQYRDKSAEDSVRLHEAQKLSQLCHQYGALLILNDRVDLALAVDADGVHLGQQDIPIALARQLLGPQRLIGRSTTSPEEMQRAIQEGADYIGVGPVYETPTKAGKPAAGLQYIRYAAEKASIPWFAIGGIDQHNLSDVLAAGAQQVAVVRAIMQAEEPALATQSLLNQLTHRQTTLASEGTPHSNYV